MPLDVVILQDLLSVILVLFVMTAVIVFGCIVVDVFVDNSLYPRKHLV
jgi:hypothetical protein